MSMGGIPTNQNSRIAERYHEGVLLRDIDLENVGLRAGDSRTVTLAAESAMGEIQNAGMSPAAQNRFKTDLLNPDTLALDSDASYLRDKLSPRPVLGPTTPLVNIDAFNGPPQQAGAAGPNGAPQPPGNENIAPVGAGFGQPVAAIGAQGPPGGGGGFAPPNGAAGGPPPQFGVAAPQFTGQAPMPGGPPQQAGPPAANTTPAGFYNQ